MVQYANRAVLWLNGKSLGDGDRIGRWRLPIGCQ